MKTIKSCTSATNAIAPMSALSVSFMDLTKGIMSYLLKASFLTHKITFSNKLMFYKTLQTNFVD